MGTVSKPPVWSQPGGLWGLTMACSRLDNDSFICSHVFFTVELLITFYRVNMWANILISVHGGGHFPFGLWFSISLEPQYIPHTYTSAEGTRDPWLQGPGTVHVGLEKAGRWQELWGLGTLLSALGGWEHERRPACYEDLLFWGHFLAHRFLSGGRSKIAHTLPPCRGT